MTQLFDDLCRILAQPMPRRKAMKSMVEVIATGATILLMPRRAFAATPTGVAPGPFGPTAACAGSCGTPGGLPPFPPVCCSNLVGSITCCRFVVGGVPVNGVACGGAAFGCNGFPNACCNPGQVCCGGVGCCTAKECCTAGPAPKGCCAPGTDCCPDPAGRNLCCPASAPVCCNGKVPRPGGLPGFDGFCCPTGCPCCATPGKVQPVTCLGPCGGADPSYTFSGGGAFLQVSCKTVCQCDVCGLTNVGDSTFVSSTSDINGVGLTCFNYCTLTLIQSISFTSFQGTLLGGGDLQASGIGTANVNGVSTNISFTATKASGTTTFLVHNTNTGEILAGGTGESGIADLGLEIFA